MKQPQISIQGLMLAAWMGVVSAAWAQAAPLRIMPVGDSITYGVPVAGGYRAPLYQLFTNAGYPIDFVGTQTGNGSASLPDPEHEGYSGWRISQVDGVILNSFNAVPAPDFILLLLGTNDYGQNDDPNNATNRLEALIAKMATARPNAKIIVANLLVRNEPFDTQIRTTFNPLLPGLCERQRALGRQVYFNDLRSAVPLSDMPDQLHPNQVGYNKMATNWFRAVTNLLETEIGPGALHAESDVYVRDGAFADMNFSSVPDLSVANGAEHREAYLRFALTNIYGPVVNARLRLTRSGSGLGGSHALTLVPDNTWSETTLTWNSRPTSGPHLGSWVVPSSGPVELAVTPAVQEAVTNGGRISFRIYAPSAAAEASYASREQPGYYAPRLTVITSNTTPTISPLSDQMIMKGETVTLPFVIGDAEKPLALLDLSASSSNTNLVPRTNLTFSGTGANRALTVVARSNQLGTATITVTVSDGVLSNDTRFLLTVVGSNNPPTLVQFSTPVVNETFAAPATIPLTVIANDPNGNVVRVEYYLSNAIIGSATSPPYNYAWANIPPGTYRLRAVATDAGGLSVTSSIRQTVVENTFTLVSAGASWRYFDVTGLTWARRGAAWLTMMPRGRPDRRRSVSVTPWLRPSMETRRASRPTSGAPSSSPIPRRSPI
jgi:lysophospholipase L1-like esterase